jgi:hypothetical protein
MEHKRQTTYTTRGLLRRRAFSRRQGACRGQSRTAGGDCAESRGPSSLYKVCTCNRVVVVVGTTRPSRAPYRVGVPEFQVDALWRRCGNLEMGQSGRRHVTAGSDAVDQPAVLALRHVRSHVRSQTTHTTHTTPDVTRRWLPPLFVHALCPALPCPASPRYHRAHARPAPVRRCSLWDTAPRPSPQTLTPVFPLRGPATGWGTDY